MSYRMLVAASTRVPRVDPKEARVEPTSGLDPGDPIVVSGAALLLSSEQVGGEITDSDPD